MSPFLADDDLRWQGIAFKLMKNRKLTNHEKRVYLCMLIEHGFTEQEHKDRVKAGRLVQCQFKYPRQMGRLFRGDGNLSKQIKTENVGGVDELIEKNKHRVNDFPALLQGGNEEGRALFLHI